MSSTKEGGSKQSSAPWVMAPNVIVRELHHLSDELLLTPAQLSAVLQCSTESLQTMRETGGGPPFLKMGDGPKAHVRYGLGDFRKWRADRRFVNTTACNVSRFSGWETFVQTGGVDDRIAAAIDSSGRMWDLWESIRHQVEVVGIHWADVAEIRSAQMSSACEFVRPISERIHFESIFDEIRKKQRAHTVSPLGGLIEVSYPSVEYSLCELLGTDAVRSDVDLDPNLTARVHRGIFAEVRLLFGFEDEFVRDLESMPTLIDYILQLEPASGPEILTRAQSIARSMSVKLAALNSLEVRAATETYPLLPAKT